MSNNKYPIRDCIYLAIIVILVWVVILMTDSKEIEEPKNNRTETLIETCEIWVICDYRQIDCTSTTCPERYRCWEERRNCETGEDKSFYLNFNCPDVKRYYAYPILCLRGSEYEVLQE